MKTRHMMNSEEECKGSILFELAIATPVILMTFFLGFDLARAMYYEFALKDFSRELAISSFTCAFRNTHSSDSCINERLDQLYDIASNVFPENETIELSFQAFQLVLEENAQQEMRRSACSGAIKPAAIRNLPIQRILSKHPLDYRAKYSFSPGNISDGTLPTIGDLFKEEEYGNILCLNRTLIVAEASFNYDPIFKFNFHSKPDKKSTDIPSQGGLFSTRRLQVVTLL
jgi:hypothetical protein